jgi:hypothetical protein
MFFGPQRKGLRPEDTTIVPVGQADEFIKQVESLGKIEVIPIAN